MNADTYNQTSNISSPSTSPILPFTRLALQLPSPIYNPTTVDFERLNQQSTKLFDAGRLKKFVKRTFVDFLQK